jgi:hypothetical protein
MPTQLDRELETYAAHKGELLASDRGKIVLIKNDEVCGTFDTQMDAIRDGYRRFGNVPFLVKQVVEVDVPAWFASNLISP